MSSYWTTIRTACSFGLGALTMLAHPATIGNPNDSPRLFVQLGHSSPIIRISINELTKEMLTLDEAGIVKLWDRRLKKIIDNRFGKTLFQDIMFTEEPNVIVGISVDGTLKIYENKTPIATKALDRILGPIRTFRTDRSYSSELVISGSAFSREIGDNHEYNAFNETIGSSFSNLGESQYATAFKHLRNGKIVAIISEPGNEHPLLCTLDALARTIQKCTNVSPDLERSNTKIIEANNSKMAILINHGLCVIYNTDTLEIINEFSLPIDTIDAELTKDQNTLIIRYGDEEKQEYVISKYSKIYSTTPKEVEIIRSPGILSFKIETETNTIIYSDFDEILVRQINNEHPSTSMKIPVFNPIRSWDLRDNRVVRHSISGKVEVWNTQTGKPTLVSSDNPIDDASISSMDFDSQGNILFAIDNHYGVRDSGKTIARKARPAFNITVIKELPSKKIAIGGTGNYINILPSRSSKPIVFQDHRLSILPIGPNSYRDRILDLYEFNGKIVSISENGTISRWNVRKRKKEASYSVDTGDDVGIGITGSATWPHGIAISTSQRLFKINPLDFKQITENKNATNGNQNTPTTDAIVEIFYDVVSDKLLAGTVDGNLISFNPSTLRETSRVGLGNSMITNIANYSNGILLVSFLSGESVLWDTREGKELATLVSFTDGTWVVTDPEGRFDTADLESMPHLHWVMPDDPFTPVPLEAFMKDYYEPRLLARILAGETFKPVRALTSLNRTQPEVKIVSVVPDASDPSLVRVTVSAAGATKSYLQGEGASSKEVPRPTAVHDLRLFRDGQVVGYADGKLADFSASASGSAFTKTFTVRLPRAKAGQDVVFSAYAFNDDRVKSETVRATYKAPALSSAVAGATGSTKGRAYVISIGVNQHENSAWNLGYAANDARAVSSRVSADLRKSAQYAEVVPLVLASDGQTQQASKAVLRAVLARLAGKAALPGDEAALQGVTGAEQLRKAQPDDLVLISFAGHGFADDTGQFYLMPQDTGAGSGKQITEALKARSIGSEELSLWLRDVDAGDMTMIVDACQSAASVQAEGFKPGPMGSRGLGQLSFDKGMRILAASQSDEFALEDQRLKHGLLTFSLINDGLEAFNADFEPKDSKVWLDEWLKYGVKRVPALADEVKSGTVKVANRGPERGAVRVDVPVTSAKPSAAARPAQQPALFDFAKKRQPVVLAAGTGTNASAVTPTLPAIQEPAAAPLRSGREVDVEPAAPPTNRVTEQASNQTTQPTAREQAIASESAAPSQRPEPSATAQPPNESTNQSKPVNACTGLKNGDAIRVPVKGFPIPQSALVLEVVGRQVDARLMSGLHAGSRMRLACSAVRRTE